MFYLENIIEEIGELDFFDNVKFVWVFELENITGRVGEVEFFDNNAFVLVLECDNIGFFAKPELVIFCNL